MGNCCGCCSNKAKQVAVQLEATLRSVVYVFPGTHYACIITPSGEVRAYVSASETAAEQSVEVISGLKLAALHFVHCFERTKCPVIHVRGTRNMFSCFDVGNNVLAFNSVMTARQWAEFNVSDADKRMAPVLDKLRLLVEEQEALTKK